MVYRRNRRPEVDGINNILDFEQVNWLKNDVLLYGSSVFAHTSTLAELTSTFRVYPSPAKDRVHIEFDLDKAQEATIELFDFQENMASELTRRFFTSGHHIHSTFLSSKCQVAGNYLIVLRTAEGQVEKSSIVIF